MADQTRIKYAAIVLVAMGVFIIVGSFVTYAQISPDRIDNANNQSAEEGFSKLQNMSAEEFQHKANSVEPADLAGQFVRVALFPPTILGGGLLLGGVSISLGVRVLKDVDELGDG